MTVDEPQTGTARPPIMAVTSPQLAVVRFHGRRTETWEARNIPVDECFRYLYDADELGEWVPRIRQAPGSVKNLQLRLPGAAAGRTCRPRTPPRKSYAISAQTSS